MNLLGNIIWLLFGGIIGAIVWFLAGLILCVTIIGIPFGAQCFKLAKLGIIPFGAVIHPTQRQKNGFWLGARTHRGERTAYLRISFLVENIV